MLFAALFLCGCASTIDALNKPPESADLPEGHGTVIGSILLSVPTGVSDIHEREMIDSLKAKKYEATIGRFVFHDYGFASRTEHPGDKYRVSFEIEVEKRFIIRAPAGTYSFQKISQIIAGIFGEEPGGCRIEGIANFDIHAGKTTYVGRLTIVAEFKPDRGGKTLQALKNLGYISSRLPEAALDMRVSATDMKEESLGDLGIDKSGPAIGLATELMRVVERRENWNCMQSPPPMSPEAPRRR